MSTALSGGMWVGGLVKRWQTTPSVAAVEAERPRCVDCSEPVSRQTVTRCRDCYIEATRKRDQPNVFELRADRKYVEVVPDGRDVWQRLDDNLAAKSASLGTCCEHCGCLLKGADETCPGCLAWAERDAVLASWRRREAA